MSDFVHSEGTISIDTGDSTVVGTLTSFSLLNREGAQVWVIWPDKPAELVGTVAPVDPAGVYDPLELPLNHPWRGDPIVDMPYELIDSVAVARGVSQMAVMTRFLSFLQQNMGLFGNLADTFDWSLVPNNSGFYDPVTRRFFLWRNGVLDPADVVGAPTFGAGDWDEEVTYAQNAQVHHNGVAFISNVDDNLNHEPDSGPPAASDQYWTILPLPKAQKSFAIPAFISGGIEDGESYTFIAPTTLIFKEDMVGSFAKAGIAATAEAVFSIRRNGVEFATVTFAAAGTTGTIACPADVTFTAGDVLKIIAPADADATLGDVAITLLGVTDGGTDDLTTAVDNLTTRVETLEMEMDAVEAANTASSLLAGFRNLLINGDGRINQRLPTSNADDTYGHDRWNVLTQSNAIAVSTVSDAENGTPRMWRLSQSNASAQRMGYAQIIEGANCKHLRGKQVTLSGRVCFSLNAAIRYAILEWTGTEDSALSDIVNSWTNGTFTAGQFFVSTTTNVLGVGTITPAAATLADLTPLTVTVGNSANNLIVVIWTEGTAAQNATLDGALQLEQGGTAKAREFRPLQTELELCQRYYEKSYNLSVAPGAASDPGDVEWLAPVSSNFHQAPVHFATRKRATPTIAIYSPVSGTVAKIRNQSDGADVNATSQGAGESGFVGQVNNVAVNNKFLRFHWTAEIEL